MNFFFFPSVLERKRFMTASFPLLSPSLALSSEHLCPRSLFFSSVSSTSFGLAVGPFAPLAGAGDRFLFFFRRTHGLIWGLWLDLVLFSFRAVVEWLLRFLTFSFLCFLRTVVSIPSIFPQVSSPFGGIGVSDWRPFVYRLEELSFFFFSCYSSFFAVFLSLCLFVLLDSSFRVPCRHAVSCSFSFFSLRNRKFRRVRVR